MISRFLFRVVLFATKYPKWVIFGFLAIVIGAPFVGIVSAKIYQTMDRDSDRGAIALKDGTFGESFEIPEYLDQGWSHNDSLWFYNTTQGSALLPYEFLLILEQPKSGDQTTCERANGAGAWVLCPKNIDRYRYLSQKKTFFNPDALPVGFVKETYQGADYVGLTCAACHTGQINYKGRAIRIDGGPAMADMVGFLENLTLSMAETIPVSGQDNPRFERFVTRLLALGNGYGDRAQIEKDLAKWTNKRILYNQINHSTFNKKEVEYGYARLDAFGRIYNRVLQYTINRDQVIKKLQQVSLKGNNLLSDAEIDKVMADVGREDDIILGDDGFWKIIKNLKSNNPGYPNLTDEELLLVRDVVFNSPNAPVSYPFLWDIAHSDYVQWNGLASNAALGPLGRNAGEVTGVFGILDWHEEKGLWADLKRYTLPAVISGQSIKRRVINFKSSIELFNLQRLESHVARLESPRWPFCKDASTGNYYLPTSPADKAVDLRSCNGDDVMLDTEMVNRGQKIYAKQCQSCHDVIVRDGWDRLVIGKLTSINNKQSTDKAMAKNSVAYQGKSGNFKNTYQDSGGGRVVVREDAPVAQILTATTSGVVATPEADKWWPRRFVEWIYSIFMTIADTPIQASVKAGNYEPDTTAKPYNSLLSYRARSLNGIWATAPYLHNGSVPSLYDLLLPVIPKGEKCAKARPKSFKVGAREFDPEIVGFKSTGYTGFEFNTNLRGNRNIGHEYGACSLTHDQRMELIEYLKSL